jgi:hypothetical protein
MTENIRKILLFEENLHPAIFQHPQVPLAMLVSKISIGQYNLAQGATCHASGRFVF